MNAILMTHPLHGATHAYDQGEVRRLQGYGWKIEEVKPAEVPESPAPHVERVVGADTDGDGVIDQVFKRKPGRPKGK